MYILGVNYKPYGGHDPSAALLHDGLIIAAAEEERFTRIKHAGCSTPINAMNFCLDFAGINLEDVDFLVQNWSRELSEKRNYFPEMASGFLSTLKVRGLKGSVLDSIHDIRSFSSMKDWDRLVTNGPEIRYIPHHVCHMASAYYPSDFNDAKVLNIEGIAENTATSFGEGMNGVLVERGSIPAPHSLGFFYSAFTEYLGFRPLNGEGKVMGLAPYGTPRYDLSDVLRITSEGFHYDTDYGFGCIMGTEIPRRFGKPRVPGSPIIDKHENIAASVQKTLERTALHVLELLNERTESANLALAGGVALNVKMNKALMEHESVERIFVQPAANDSGSAIGAAMELYRDLKGKRRWIMKDAYLGPAFSDDTVSKILNGKKISGYLKENQVEWTEESDLSGTVAELISQGKIVGWFQGRMEFGPRALGNRSILADPRDPRMKLILNKKVKFREVFRPYCPSVLEKHVTEYFDNSAPAPFMTLSFDVNPELRETIQAVVHVDGTSRPQTVNRNTNERFWFLLRKFHEITGVPMVLNTSFNVRGEPIVNRPEEAISCFLKTGLDCLAIGNILMEKICY
ncbi:MAG: carbamoyltransferase C-terminal domain-containing protein [Candidatus Thermoplasmatota archaeon]|nr:carbamoyltransferase C-terminal domain-containing protein [Candidatus Thermoplasmatota archaeon]MDP7265640.1 carbamoyltransferase C-terminal domain-containing protein [Candidatus Thermoplasmatota archaeon]